MLRGAAVAVVHRSDLPWRVASPRMPLHCCRQCCRPPTSRISGHERIRSAEIRNGRFAAAHRRRLADPRPGPLHDRRDAGGHAHRLRSAVDAPRMRGSSSAIFRRRAPRPASISSGPRRTWPISRSMPCLAQGTRHERRWRTLPIPVLCGDTVKHVGDAIAFIVADDLNSAKSAAELIEVDYESLPAIADTAAALQADAALVWPERKSNLAFEYDFGDKAATDAAFAVGGQGRRDHDRQQPPRLQLHGAARHRRRIRCGERPLHRHRRLAGRARAARRLVQGAEARPEAHARAHPRRRRRLRHQGLQLPGISAGREGREDAAAAGEVGIRPQRAFPRRRARPRPRDDRRVRARCRRADHGDAGGHHRRHRLLLQPVRAVHPLARDHHGDRPLRHPHGPRDLQGRLHQHRPDRRLSRRRAPGGGLFHRAADGRGGARHRPFAGRDPAAQLHQAGADALQDGDGPRLRHRRVRRPHAGRRSPRPTKRASRRGLRRARRSGRIRGLGFATYIEICAFGRFRAGQGGARSGRHREPSISARSRRGRGTRPPTPSSPSGRSASTTTKCGSCRAIPTRSERGGGTGGSRSIPLGAPSVDRASRQLAEQIKELAADELEAGIGDIELDRRQRRASSAPTAPSPTRSWRARRPTRASSPRSASSRRKSTPTRTARMSARSRSTRTPAAPTSWATRSSTISARR